MSSRRISSGWPAPCATRPSTPTGRRKIPPTRSGKTWILTSAASISAKGCCSVTTCRRNSFAWHYLHSQQPGTSETSRFPTDFINGPILINSIYRLNERLKLDRAEQIIRPAKGHEVDEQARRPARERRQGLRRDRRRADATVPQVLSDGADSMGLVIAATRVYVNEGWLMIWVSTTWALNPVRPEGEHGPRLQAIGIRHSRQDRKDPNSPWMQTEARMPNMALFLSTHDSSRSRTPLRPTARNGQRRRQGLSHDRRGRSPQGEDRLRRSLRPLPQQQAAKPDAGRLEAEKQAWRDLVCGTTSSRTTSCPTTSATPARSWVPTHIAP